MPSWSPDSWRTKPIAQRIDYPDAAALRGVLVELAQLPPLVTSWEVEALKEQLAAAARGERFLLQGGDCSESFDDCRPAIIASNLKVLLKMSLVLIYGCRERVVRVGRIAGQYAKPRSSPTETRDGVTLPSYRGPLINRPGFSTEERMPRPANLLEGYHRAAMTINFVRALVGGGFADLHHPELWNVDFVRHAAAADDYFRIVESIGGAIRFMEAAAGHPLEDLSRVDFYTSHEGLHLDYEQAQTRQVPRRPGKWYNLCTHFPWIGDRTRQLDGGARGVLPRHRQSDRREGRPVDDARRAAGVDRRARSRRRAGTLDADPSLRLEAPAAVPAAADRIGARPRPTGHLVLRPDARQYGGDLVGRQDPLLR